MVAAHGRLAQNSFPSFCVFGDLTIAPPGSLSSHTVFISSSRIQICFCAARAAVCAIGSYCSWSQLSQQIVRARLPISLYIVHGHLKGMCCSQCITRPLQPVLHERKARTRCNIGPRHIGHVETLSGGVQGVIAEWQGCHAVVNR